MSDEKTYGSDMTRAERHKLYAEMTDLGDIARRYFVMNFFDGVLTVLGIVMGGFINYLLSPENAPSQIFLVASAIATSVAIGISGITGGYLSERAERKRNIIELHRAMVDFETPKEETANKFHEEDYYPTNSNDTTTEKNKENLTPKTEPAELKPVENSPIQKRQKQEKTLAERAESYASWIASLINGVSPAAGGLIVTIPFFFSNDPDWVVYTISFVIIAIVLFALGGYLARISKDSVIKYGVKMTLVGIITAGFSFLLYFLR